MARAWRGRLQVSVLPSMSAPTSTGTRARKFPWVSGLGRCLEVVRPGMAGPGCEDTKNLIYRFPYWNIRI